MDAEARATRFFGLLMKLQQVHETYKGYTLQEIAAVDGAILGPMLEFAKDVELFGEEMKTEEPVIWMSWPHYFKVEGRKLREKNPEMTQQEVLKTLGPMWRALNVGDGN